MHIYKIQISLMVSVKFFYHFISHIKKYAIITSLFNFMIKFIYYQKYINYLSHFNYDIFKFLKIQVSY